MSRSTRTPASARRSTWARLLDPGPGDDDAGLQFAVARRYVAARGGSDRERRTARLDALAAAAGSLDGAAFEALCWGCGDDEVRFVAGYAATALDADPSPAELAGWLFADPSRGVELDAADLVAAASHDLGAVVAVAAFDSLPLEELPAALEARRDPFAGANLLADQLLEDACASWHDASAARAAGDPALDTERLAAKLAEACASLTSRWSAQLRRCDAEIAEVVGPLGAWSAAAHFYALAAGPRHRDRLRRSAHQDTNTVLSLLQECGCDDVEGLFERIDADEAFADRMVAEVPRLAHRSHLGGLTMCHLGAYALWRRGCRSAFALAALETVVPPPAAVPPRLLAPLAASLGLAERAELLSVLCDDARRVGLNPPSGLVDHAGVAAELGSLMGHRVLSLSPPLHVDLDELAAELATLAGRPPEVLDGRSGAGSRVEQLADATWTAVCLHMGRLDLADDDEVDDVPAPAPEGPAASTTEAAEPSRLPEPEDCDGWAELLGTLDPTSLTGPDWAELFDAVTRHATVWDDGTLVAASVAVAHPAAPRVPAGGVAAAAVFAAAGDVAAARAAASAALDAAHLTQHDVVADALSAHVDLTGLRPAAPPPPSADPAAHHGDPPGEVRVLWVGGNETQSGYVPALLAELADRYGGRVSVEFVFPGWSSNWGRYADQVERRLAAGDVDAVVCHYFVRTGLGRAVRRAASAASVPWVAAQGHGRDAMRDAVLEAVGVADSVHHAR